MVRMGTVVPRVWDDLEQKGLSKDEFEEEIVAKTPTTSAVPKPDPPEKIAEEVIKEMKVSCWARDPVIMMMRRWT